MVIWRWQAEANLPLQTLKNSLLDSVLEGWQQYISPIYTNTLTRYPIPLLIDSLERVWKEKLSNIINVSELF